MNFMLSSVVAYQRLTPLFGWQPRRSTDVLREAEQLTYVPHPYSQGKLDPHGFAIAKHLMAERMRGCNLPSALPPHLSTPPHLPPPSPVQAEGGHAAVFHDALTPR